MSQAVINFIKPHLNKPNVEIEFRLGKINNGYFDTNVGKETFERVYRRLGRYPEWESVKVQNACVFYGARKGLRVVYDEDKDEQVECVTKHKIAHLDQKLDQERFDVRVGVAIETPTTYDQERDVFTKERRRNRTSFVRKGLSIDMSVVGNDDKDSENPLLYQIEFEIQNVDACLKNEAQIASHYQKIFDVLRLTSS